MSRVTSALSYLCKQLFIDNKKATSGFFHEKKLIIQNISSDACHLNLKNMAMACLIMHKTKIDNEDGDVSVVFSILPLEIKNFILMASKKHNIPPVGSLELFFFKNYYMDLNVIHPIYSWVESEYTSYFNDFFRIPILIEHYASDVYSHIDNQLNDHLVFLNSLLKTIDQVRDLFKDVKIQSQKAISVFHEKIQPFMTWGGGFNGDNNIYIGASGTMSPFFNVLHEFFGIESSSLMQCMLIKSRGYMTKNDRERIHLAREYGREIRTGLKGTFGIEQYNLCVKTFYSLRQLHTKIAVKTVKKADDRYASTGMTTRIDNYHQTLDAFKQLNLDTRDSRFSEEK